MSKQSKKIQTTINKSIMGKFDKLVEGGSALEDIMVNDIDKKFRPIVLFSVHKIYMISYVTLQYIR